MVRRLAMGHSWTGYGFHLFCFLLFILLFEIYGCCFLNSEGLALSQFRLMVDIDPTGALADWNPSDCEPCMWSGIECLDGNVVMLNLSGRDLEGELSPELGNLTHLRYLLLPTHFTGLDLSKNHLSGTIPRQFGQLTTLEVLDLRDNNLTGTVPAELGELHSLKRLLLCNNRFEGIIPVKMGKLSLLSDVRFDGVFSTSGISCINRKFGHSIWQSVLKQSKKSDFLQLPSKQTITNYLNLLPKMIGSEPSDSHRESCRCYLTDSSEPDVIENTEEHVKNVHRVLPEQSGNPAVSPPNIAGGAADPSETDPPPAVPNPKPTPATPVLEPSNREKKSDDTAKPSTASPPNDKDSSAEGNSGNLLKLIIGISVAVGFIIVIILLCIIRSRAAKNIGPWKTGLSGQLQKAFVTGVPKLNRDELETACEDFSNIIYTHEGVATLYKGTLSSGVEIAVASTAINSANDWSKQAELLFRKKIDTLSRVNHKNFVNLIGYCEENEPFTRMMVFEYAPNGSLFDYLHVKELEDLGWDARIRVIMGAAYCLQHMHALNPPVPHHYLTSKEVLLTDDYAAKIADMNFWADFVASLRKSAEHESDHSELSRLSVETNICSFGILMLEIISGKLPQSEEDSDTLTWANQYLNDKTTYSELVDPNLKSFTEKELHVVCEAIRSCIHQNPTERPTINEVIEKLRQAIGVSPEAATPRLSPLWWAELEILSSETA